MAARIGLLVALLLLCCASAAAAAGGEGVASRVLVLGVGGLGSSYMQDASLYPNIQQLMSSGASSMDARAALPTVSKPNWASVLKGAGPEEHGVDADNWYYRDTCVNYGVLDSQCVQCASCTTLVNIATGAIEPCNNHQNDPRLGNATEAAVEDALHSACDTLKIPLKTICNTAVDLFGADIFEAVVLGQSTESICLELGMCRNELQPITGPDTVFPTIFGAVKDAVGNSAVTAFFTDDDIVVNLLEKRVVDYFAYMPGQTSMLVSELSTVVTEYQPLLAFMHFGAVQEAGLQYGYGSSQYGQALADTDAYIGQLLQAYDSAGLLADTAVFVVGDHGGNGTSDGVVDMVDLLVPWIASGPGVRVGYEIQNYVRGMDIASTALYSLGISQPSVWIGRAVEEIFSDAAVKVHRDSQVATSDVPAVAVVIISALTTEGLVNTNATHLHSMAQGGAFTLASRAAMPSTSLTNIASIIMGAGTEEHGVCDGHQSGLECSWSPPPATPDITPISGAGSLFPSIFDVVSDAGMPTASFYTWPSVAELYSNGTVTVDYHAQSDQDGLAQAASYLQGSSAGFTLVQLQGVADAADRTGYNSTDYSDAVVTVDGLVGDFLAQVAGEDLVVFVISDHGGVRYEDGKTDNECMVVPWIAAGTGVLPGNQVTSYVRGMDTASTAAYILHLAQPEPWIGRPIVEIFE